MINFLFGWITKTPMECIHIDDIVCLIEWWVMFAVTWKASVVVGEWLERKFDNNRKLN